MARVTDRKDWFDLWFEDKKCIIATMSRNIASDLKAGYDFFGNSIQKQIKGLEEYKAKVDYQLDEFKHMEDKEVNKWCFYELKKKGAIE